MSHVHQVHNHRSIHERLKQATRNYHDRLEGSVPLLDPSFSISQLHEVLRAFYGYYAPLEAAMDSLAIGWLRAEVRRRRKVQWLVQDLSALGDTDDTIARLPLCTDLPLLTTNARLLGSMYVLEGATLGGQMVAQSLRKTLGYTSGRFFESYGSQVRVMWESLLAALAAAAIEMENEQEIIEAACDTFSCFEQWLTHPAVRSA